MRPMAEPDPYPDDPDPYADDPDPYSEDPAIPDTQAWVEIAYLDSCSNYREALLQFPSQTKLRSNSVPIRWLCIIIAVMMTEAAAIWAFH